ncbi:MAG: sensor histidine kinase [Romboutsia sp.]|uniref:HAMP domain-containing sensor histidine kinase n=1 Tax=Romboutsia sp. TaxID=1965302 RepID=UPI003F335044
MRTNKTFKFICLVISFVCVSTLISMIPTSVRMIETGSGVLSSYMSDTKFGIESNFYNSRAFDDDLIGYLTDISSRSVRDIGDDKADKDYKEREKEKKLTQETLDEIVNAKYFVINNDTKEIYTNTEYKTSQDFVKNISGECDVKIKSEDYNISYDKKVGEEEYSKPNVNNQLGSRMALKNGEIYISIPENFTNYMNHYDQIYQAKIDFDNNIMYMLIIIAVSGVAFVLGIISIILYKRNKSYLFEEDSFWLKMSKVMPLEVYLFGLFLAVNFAMQGMYWGYDIVGTFFSCFFGIGFIMTVFYIFNRQMNTYDNKLDIFKTTFIYRILRLLKGIISKIVRESRGITRSMPLAKRIIVIGIICLFINVIGWIMDVAAYSYIFSLGAAVISLVGFTYYVLKKLSYLSYIIDGTARIKNGDIHHKLTLVGDDNFTELADNINNIRDGLDNAIDSQLRSERMKSELITNVSHDLKTPLTSIINYIALIKKEEDIKPEYLKDYINVLDSKSKRLKVLIEDLFEASKASSGNIELNMEKIELTQLLRQSIGELDEKLSESNLDLKINVPEEKVYIRADGRRMYRVLENLLGNISKYSLPNTRVYIDILEEDDRVKLTMKNISSYELNFDPDEIMERFKRADDSRNTEGSGLGLAIARDLINLQGGSFKIDIDGDLFKSIVEFNSIH